MSRFLKKTNVTSSTGTVEIDPEEKVDESYEIDGPYETEKFITNKKFITDKNPKASPTDHRQVKWSCIKCHNHGIAWVKKNNKLESCPKCGIAGHTLYSVGIHPMGSYRDLWQETPKISSSGLQKLMIKKLHRNW